MGNKAMESTLKSGLSIREICEILEGVIICNDDKADQTVKTACGCDLMSDVLAFTKSGSVLLTGLTNLQVIRTAEMLDLKAVVFVRNKRPDDSMMQLAKKTGIVIILSPYPLYESCGRLYASGLKGCKDMSKQNDGILMSDACEQ